MAKNRLTQNQSTQNNDDNPFPVDPWVDRIGGFIHKHQKMFIKLGNFESKILFDTLDDIKIEKPIYIAGIARAGTTILLELLADHPGVTTHRYKDYPPIFTPYWWNWYLDHSPAKKSVKVERAHKDGIFITPDSPEAMEEVLWMSFFTDTHNPKTNNQLTEKTVNTEFEDFYLDHIKKLMAIRGGNRYLSKGNYNLARIAYIQSIIPSAKFIIPVREPSSHIASLMKQHKLFCDGMKNNPKAIEHLRRVGHFEFGPDLRPINMGDQHIIDSILDDWENANDQNNLEVRGWAKYWNAIYSTILQQLEENPRLKKATFVLKYEDLCANSTTTLNKILDHCNLEEGQPLVEHYASKLMPPSYYKPTFSDNELAIIHTETASARDMLNYDK